MFKSRGTCEICKVPVDCNEMPSKDLPLPQKEPVESKREHTITIKKKYCLKIKAGRK